ncbi:MAG: class I SAM-dependent methyltransferase [Parvularcula sp.]
MSNSRTLATLLLAASALAVTACSEKSQAPAAAPEGDASAAETHAAAASGESQTSALADILADGTIRSESAMARDVWRHPEETLNFFGLKPGMTVVEVWPGGGWYTDILAPYLATGNGTLIAAHFAGGNAYQDKSLATFEEKYTTGEGPYGKVVVSHLGAETGPLGQPGSADMVLTFRNVHNWISGDFADKAFKDFYAVLKPGGTLGVVEHRLPEDRDTADEKTSGYVKVSTVVALAEDAGFELVEESEINANPADTADHPFGVWTLPPSSRQKARDGSVPEGFDPSKYKAIGESDRMTLKFRKPIDADGPLLE